MASMKPLSEESPSAAMARVVFQPNGRQGVVPVGTNLLQAARQLGVEIESICGGHQTCGKCMVLVEEGDFPKFGLTSSRDHLSPPGDRERAYAERRRFPPGARLSCACSVTGDLVVRVPEESQTRKQVVRKGAGIARRMTVDAAMRLYYVELPPAHLKDHRGDWERLAAALAETHGLEDLRIDLAALRELQPALDRGGRRVTATVLDRQEVVRVQPGFLDVVYGISLDIGTTTMAAHLCNLRTGDLLGAASRMNPQVPYGEDLMSRVSYAMLNADGVERMQGAVIEAINGMIAELSDGAGIQPQDVVELVAVGNTTMHHLLLGINPRELGGTPFSLATHGALNVKARELGIAIAPGGNVFIPPCEAGHVGADNVAVLVAEAPYAQDEMMLVIDVGTNGEILLGNRQGVYSASSPTGPAFEGAQIVHGMRAAEGAIERVRIDPATLEVRYKVIGRDDWLTSKAEEPRRAEETAVSEFEKARERRQRMRAQAMTPEVRASGICGSGIIEAVAELFWAGLVAPNGRFVQMSHPRLRTAQGNGAGKAEFVLAWGHETSTGREIVIHADDVRAIQLAKAALYAGTKLLMQRLGLERIDRIVLAGGFGSYIDPRHAMALGMIPDCELARVKAVGNAAGDGARMMLLDRNKRAEAAWAARWVQYVETAGELSFQEEFVSAINIPHALDSFPRAEAMVLEASKLWTDERRQGWLRYAGGGFEGIRSLGRDSKTADAPESTLRRDETQQSKKG